MSSDVMVEEDETLEIEREGKALDKKAGLTKRPSKTQPVRAEVEVDMANGSVPPTATKVEPFKPVNRLVTDQPPDDETWITTDNRQKAEALERGKIVARMTNTEQLGLNAGLIAEDVKKLRRQIRTTEKSLATYKQKLVGAEALLMARLTELLDTGL